MRQSEHGFTLLEVVIGVLLVFLLGAASTGIFTVLTTGYRLTVPVSENIQNTQAALNFMTREMRGGTNFSGGPDQIFFTNPSGQNVAYFLIGNQLIRRVGGVDTPMANNINNLVFNYNGEPPNPFSLIRIQVNGMTQDVRPR